MRSKPFLHHGRTTIYNDDIVNLKSIEENSVDLIVTSPPYGVDIKYVAYDDNSPYDKYLEFTAKWLAKCLELAKPDGRFCLNIPLDKNKGGQRSVYADVMEAAQQVGWKYHSTVVWNEQNTSRRTAWGSWMSASAPYVIAPVEMVPILYKEKWGKQRKGVSDISRQEFMDWTNGVWTFGGETRKVGHPAPFPIELPRRCVKLFSYVGDTVLDPFMGSGSTLIACLQNNRVGIGVDISEKYCEIAVQRLVNFGLMEEKREKLA